MRILLDECVPRGLRRLVQGHVFVTVAEAGWAGKKNGALMQLVAANGYDVFLTVDKSVRFQQDLQSLPFAVILMSAPTNRLTDLAPLVPKLTAALATIQSGNFIEIRPDGA
jgi:hypothetical protein